MTDLAFESSARWSARLGPILVVSACPGIGAAQEDYAPPQPLMPVAEAILEIEPRELALDGDRLLVAGVSDDGTDLLVAVDVGSLEILQSQPLGVHAEAIHVSADGRQVVVVGHDEENSVVEVLDEDLFGVHRVELPRRFEESVSFLGLQGTLVVLGGSPADTNGYIVGPDLAEAEPVEGSFIGAVAFGALDVWLSESQDVLFVNGVAGPSLGAVDSHSGLPIDGLVNRYPKGEPTPFSALGLLDDLPCRDGTSFLVADNDNATLALVDYDATFRTLDVKARTTAAPRLVPGTVAATYEGSNRRRPAALLASSCDQSVIWLGNTYSDQILQFARNPAFGALEKIGDVELGFQPSALILGVDGSFGFATTAQGRRLVRFGPADSEATGDDRVRMLQRWLTYMGLDIGLVDGILGQDTRQAVTSAESELGVDLDVENDLEGAIDALRGAVEN